MKNKVECPICYSHNIIPVTNTKNTGIALNRRITGIFRYFLSNRNHTSILSKIGLSLAISFNIINGFLSLIQWETFHKNTVKINHKYKCKKCKSIFTETEV